MNTYVAIVLLCTFAHQGDLCTEETALPPTPVKLGPYYNWHVCMRAANEQAVVLGEQIGYSLGRGGWFKIRCPRDLPA